MGDASPHIGREFVWYYENGRSKVLITGIGSAFKRNWVAGEREGSESWNYDAFPLFDMSLDVLA